MAAIPGHNLPMAVSGTLILAFGWFGFNAGSTLAPSDPRIAIIAGNTLLPPRAGVFIGVIAGLIVVWRVIELERRFRIDDPVGAVAVHGACGIWGALALGLFADGTYGDGWNGIAGPVRGLLYGDPSQFFAQLIGVTVNLVVVFSLAMLFFTIIERTIAHRVLVEGEWS